ncbi:phosphatase PAP2 family protein [Mycobacterium sp. IDR2000157661]|uniref:phosphatase PAP2 family protein n=1 Tax=Mycobacterium sp. IDR2000157661 TaxID=2867005 RepID=UPI001EEBAD05|nr:phosphatase PAP2 family protein [Mycobacterium sp. IDR2000157661]ULE33508.1 phosphatase PAP2 family protein [Mycobacterium sp. IDR2000157661]
MRHRTSAYLLIGSGALFLLLLVLVATGWRPLKSADQAILDALNTAVSGSPLVQGALTVVTSFGGSIVAWIALAAAVVWLLIRREGALAVYVTLTGLGATALTSGIKALVDRPRPTVEAPVAAAPGLSFPSGHSLGSAVTYGVLVLVFLPIVAPRWRRSVITVAVAMVLAIGVSRMALGVHYPSDVLGGWLLGIWWITLTAIAFRRWHSAVGLGSPPLTEGLEPEEREHLQPAPEHDPPLPAGWYSVVNLLVAAVLIWGATVALGFLVTSVAVLRSMDASVARWFADIRSEALTDVFFTISRIGDTSSVVAVLLVTAAILFALTDRRRPSLFLGVAVGGEVLLFLAIARVVGRTRPDVEHLSPGLPPTSSFPSGHVAATMSLYGAVAVLIVLWSRSSWRYLALGAALLLAVAVAVARMYIGVHYVTDGVASILFVTTWLAACWWTLRPGPDAQRDRHDELEKSTKG